MTEIRFHVNVPNAAIYTCRLVRKAVRSGAKVTAVHVEESSGPKLDEATIVVSGGRGLGEAGKYEMIEQLAKLLRGAPGASRAIVDVTAAEARKAGEIVEDDGEGYLKVIAFLEGLKVI